MKILLSILVLISFCSNANNNIEDILKATADEIKKTIPIKVDDESTLIGISTVENKIIYEMRMDNIDLSTLEINDFKKLMMDGLKQYNCSENVVMDVWKKNKVVIVYKFWDRHNKYILDTTIRLMDCDKT